MNIIIIGTAFPLRGGIAHFNALLAGHLAARHHVETITFSRQYPSMFFPGTSQMETSGDPDHAPPPAPRLVDSINPLNWIGVAREIRRRNPDLLIFKYWMPFFGPCFGTIARLAKRGSHARVLFICDNVIPHERRPGDVLFTRYAFRQGDFFIVQSDAVERDLLREFPGVRYRRIPHPVYTNFGPPLSKAAARTALGISAERVILYFGYVRPYKGLMVLLEAMSALKSRYAEDGGRIQLLIVGEFYDDEGKYRARVRDLDLESTVRIAAGYAGNDDVARYFSAADLVVLPYLSATQSGIAQIAYNFERPVVATNVGGLAEVILDGKTGYIVPPNDPAALADAIERFYRDRMEEVFTANIHREKQRYSWESFVTGLEELVSGDSGTEGTP